MRCANEGREIQPAGFGLVDGEFAENTLRGGALGEDAQCRYVDTSAYNEFKQCVWPLFMLILT